jgi:hypothetical protein
MVDHCGEYGAGSICHRKVLHLHRVERIGQIVNGNRVVAGVGGVEACAGVIYHGPTGRNPRVRHRSHKGEAAVVIVLINGYLAHRRNIHIDYRKVRVGSHPERQVAASQPHEDGVRQRLRKILI